VPADFEPYAIRSVEPLSFATAPQREAALQAAGFNLYALPSDLVTIDLLTDSGTTGLSTRQLAAAAESDEAYAGSRSWDRMREAVTWLTGFPEVIPTPQGRTAEWLILEQLVKPGDVVPSNAHFNTTRANVEALGASAVDLALASPPASGDPFKGDLDVGALERLTGSIAAVVVTVTNNAVGGHPVSLENLTATKAICRRRGFPLLLDACRYAENAWLIRGREASQRARPVLDIARDVFALADGCWVSAKKDGLTNIGGYLALRDRDLADRCRRRLTMVAGLPSYGGLAGYDMELIAAGIPESVDERLLAHRERQIHALADRLRDAGVPLMEPPGGHAVYVDAKRFLPHLEPSDFPGQALAVELYRAGGVRAIEVGSLMFGRGADPWRLELTKLSVPRRRYTDNHLRHVADVVAGAYSRRNRIAGLRLVHEDPALRHFTARFEPAHA
jgi:tryptophanase